MAEWSAHWTRNPVVLGSSPALATSWICSRSSRVQIPGHACKQPTGCFLPVGVFNPVMLYLNLFVCKYLSGVPVNQLDKLSALSTINKPLNLFIDIILFQEEIEAEKNRICEYFKTGEGQDVQLTSLYLQINPTRFVWLKL